MPRTLTLRIRHLEAPRGSVCVFSFLAQGVEIGSGVRSSVKLLFYTR